MSATDIFLERIRNAFADEIPDRVYKRAKESLLDYIRSGHLQVQRQ